MSERDLQRVNVLAEVTSRRCTAGRQAMTIGPMSGSDPMRPDDPRAGGVAGSRRVRHGCDGSALLGSLECGHGHQSADEAGSGRAPEEAGQAGDEHTQQR